MPAGFEAVGGAGLTTSFLRNYIATDLDRMRACVLPLPEGVVS